MVGVKRKVRDSENYSSPQKDWGDLPIDLLRCILDKVALLQDYVRFGAVCKSWYFVTREHKQKRKRQVEGFKESPLLLVPVADNPNERVLYSVCEGKIYNHLFSIPYRKRCCGASDGWLAIPEEESVTKDLYIRLFNPFSGSSMQLPPIMNNMKIYRNIGKDPSNFKIPPEFQIRKVILSCDPSLYPDDYVVAAIYDVDSKLTWLKSGQRSWNLGRFNLFMNRPLRKKRPFSDILFHKGLLYGITYNPENYLVFTDELDVGDNNVEEKNEKGSPTLRQLEIEVDDSYNQCRFKPYIVESSNGNVLLIRRIYLWIDMEGISPERINTVDFKIYKLKLDDTNPHNGEGKWIEIKSLENDDVLFLGPSSSVCVPASRAPNCKSNCIYYTDEYSSHSDYQELCPYEAKDMGVFHLDDRSWEHHFTLDPSISYMAPAAWISPTLN